MVMQDHAALHTLEVLGSLVEEVGAEVQLPEPIQNDNCDSGESMMAILIVFF